MSDVEDKPKPYVFVYTGDPSQWFTGPIKHLLRAGWLPPHDPLHSTGRCMCAGEGECLWCLWTEKREEVVRLRELHEAAVSTSFRFREERDEWKDHHADVAKWHSEAVAERDLVKAKLAVLLATIDPDGKYALTPEAEEGDIIHALNNLTQRAYSKGNLDGLKEAEAWKAKYDELAEKLEPS